MPITPAYPGVYVQEITSGIRTITGVSTSVTAFIGGAKKGPIDQPVRILSYSDFERNFGGLCNDYEMTYAVHQFFNNEGSDAWVVRLGSPADCASKTLYKTPEPTGGGQPGGGDQTPLKVLKIKALNKGASGNNIKVFVDYVGSNNTFKFTFEYTDPTDPDNPMRKITESFQNLSMNRKNPRSVESIVNDTSALVTVERLSTPRTFEFTQSVSTSGYLTDSGNADGILSDILKLIDHNHNQFRISINRSAPITIMITDENADALKNLSNPDKLKKLCGFIQEIVIGNNHSNFKCKPDNSTHPKRIHMTNPSSDEYSSVIVLPGEVNDLAANLRLGILNNGEEVEAAAVLRPDENKNGENLERGTETPVSSDNSYSSYIGNREKREGIYALESVDLFNIMCLPGVTNHGILSNAIAYCKERRAFLIIDPPKPDISPTPSSSSPLNGIEEFINRLPKSDYAAVYYPWIKIADPLNNGKPRLTAPCGSVAGVYARTDSNRGVWKAPAGTDAAAAAQSVAYVLTDSENGVLNPKAINCIRVLPAYGVVVWGARTLQGNDNTPSDWKYIPVRRLALYIEESLYRGTQWVVFEPNDEPLWAQIRLNIGAFMHRLFRQGAFKGSSPRDAYVVKCDSETTTQDDINRGIVNIIVGFAPLKPAEFVFIYIQQLAGKIET